MLALLLPSALLAQMGGMRGGMGGGMGRGGMGRGGMGGPRMESPAERARKTLDEENPLKLLLDHKKPLQLTRAQRDTFKAYEKELKERQEPLFTQLDQLFSALGPGRGRGGMGGRRRGGGGGGGEPPEAGAEERGGATVPDSAKRMLDRLMDIQDAYRDRARAQLDSTQRVRADSIQSARLAEQREAAMQARDGRRARRRG